MPICPFALVSVGFLLCQQKSDRPMFAAASGLLAAAAYLFRTAGLALFLAWIAESLIRRRFGQAAIRVAICALPVLLWQGHVWRVTHSYEYHHPGIFVSARRLLLPERNLCREQPAHRSISA